MTKNYLIDMLFIQFVDDSVVAYFFLCHPVYNPNI